MFRPDSGGPFLDHDKLGLDTLHVKLSPLDGLDVVSLLLGTAEKHTHANNMQKDTCTSNNYTLAHIYLRFIKVFATREPNKTWR